MEILTTFITTKAVTNNNKTLLWVYTPDWLMGIRSHSQQIESLRTQSWWETRLTNETFCLYKN